MSKNLQTIAREAAGKIPISMDASYPVILHAIETAVGEAEDDFIDRLITALESHGIDATNWDGDDPAHVIIASGIAGIVTELRAQVDTKDKTIGEICEALECSEPHDEWSPVHEVQRLKAALEQARKEIERLVALLGDAQLHIEAFYVDWALLNRDSPDYDASYKPEFPPIVDAIIQGRKGAARQAGEGL